MNDKNSTIKILATLLAFLLVGEFVGAQSPAFYNGGAAVFISGNGLVRINGSLENNTGSITNQGTLELTGDAILNAPLTYSAAGAVIKILGSAPQNFSGSTEVKSYDLVMNNPSGINTSIFLRVDHTLSFISGLINANNTQVVFSDGAGYNNVSDNSHVNGTVTKNGTGNFSYPVGNDTKLQKIDINLSAADGGVRVRYRNADAGAAPFTTTGSESTPLTSYNNNEYWDITPNATATGTVTLFWDGYQDNYPETLNKRRVAHKNGGNWLNEGTGNATGTINTGSVTSNTISSWSPFTLGLVGGTVLPVKWLSVAGKINGVGVAEIKWQVQEWSVADYVLEKSENALQYRAAGNIKSKGDGVHQYLLPDNEGALNGTAYYRVKQISKDGNFSYSDIIKLHSEANKVTTVYPTLFTEGFTVKAAQLASGRLYDAGGKLVELFQFEEGTNNIVPKNIAKGVYILKINTGESFRLIKH